MVEITETAGYRPPALEIRLQLDLGDHAPADMTQLAKAIAADVEAIGREHAPNAEAALSPDFLPRGLKAMLRLNFPEQPPGNIERLAQAIAGEIEANAQQYAADAAEASFSEEVFAARPGVEFRVTDSNGWTEWRPA